MSETDRYHQSIVIHNALWDPEVDSVQYDGETYRIVRRDTATRQFAMVTFRNGIRYVTQNMAKNSKWTEWVLKHERNRLTWVFRGDSYSARVQETSRKVEVILLGPDQLAYEQLKEEAS